MAMATATTPQTIMLPYPGPNLSSSRRASSARVAARLIVTRALVSVAHDLA